MSLKYIGIKMYVLTITLNAPETAQTMRQGQNRPEVTWLMWCPSFLHSVAMVVTDVFQKNWIMNAKEIS